MRKIKIKRENEAFNQNFDYKILIDNELVTSLKNGEEKIIEFSENARYVEAKINSGTSKKLAIDNLNSDQKILVAGDSFRNKYLKYAGALIPLIALTFILRHQYEIIKILGGIIFASYLLFIMYVLIFQKEKWLHLKIVD